MTLWRMSWAFLVDSHKFINAVCGRTKCEEILLVTHQILVFAKVADIAEENALPLLQFIRFPLRMTPQIPPSSKNLIIEEIV
jgi:hypothetical protein